MQRRDFLIATGAVLGVGCTGFSRRHPSVFDSVVCQDRQRRFDVPVFDSINAALAAAQLAAPGPQRILITRGEWRERLRIDHADIHLIGEHRQHCVIRANAAAGTPGPDGKPLGTWGCATITVSAPGFLASNLRIENDFDYIGELRKPTLAAIGSNGPQAVALMLAEGSDRVRFRDVDIVSHQDTLFVDAGGSDFRDCRISGSVDFIFGAGHAVFDRCELLSRFRPGKTRQGYVAAPSTLRSQDFGLVFRRCRLLADPEIPNGSVALGRAWRPARDFVDGRYGDPDAMGSATYVDCHLGAHIAPEGWDAMNFTARDGTRTALQPADARFAEYANRGPGSSPSRRAWSRQQFDAAVKRGLFVAVAATSSS